MSLPSNKLKLSLLALLALAALSLYVFFTQKSDSKSPSLPTENLKAPSSANPTPTAPTISAKPIKKLPPLEAKTIPSKRSDFPSNPRFSRYASPEQSVHDDLETIHQTLQAFWTFLKNPDALSVRSNASIIKSLTGRNPEGIHFIPADSVHINEKGELLDRWQTPLHFHPESLTRIDIRSAGPDRDLFTEDDVVLLSRRSGPRA